MVAAVLLKKTVPAFPVCESVMAALARVSLWQTPRAYRTLNKFAWGQAVEVAVLFAGIFVAMVPALALLRKHGSALGVAEPWQFFWLTGVLSSLLDNAPTYLTMGKLAVATGNLGGLPDLMTATPRVLAAISCGAVLSFFGYAATAAVILLPIFVGVTVISFL